MDEPAPQYEISGYARLTPTQQAHFAACLLRAFLPHAAVAGSLQPGDSWRAHGDRHSGHPDLLLQASADGRLLVCDLAPPGRSLLAKLRGFLRSYPRPATFPPLSLRAHGLPAPARKSARTWPQGPKTRIRLLGAAPGAISAGDWLAAVLPALYSDDDLAAASDAAAEHVARIDAGSIWWYPHAIDAHRTRLLGRLGIVFQGFPWAAGADELPALCAHCLAWLRSVPAGDLPGAPFLVRAQAALWQCPRCGGVYVDDPSAGKAGERAMLSPRQLRERFGVAPPAAVAAWALPP